MNKVISREEFEQTLAGFEAPLGQMMRYAQSLVEGDARHGNDAVKAAIIGMIDIIQIGLDEKEAKL